MRYALLNPDNAIDRYLHDIDTTVQTKAGWRWVEAPEVQRPSFDPATQILTGPIVAVDGGAVTETYSVRAKTAEEFDAAKETTLGAYGRLSFDVNFDQENRIRSLEGKQAITRAQYRAALKARL